MLAVVLVAQQAAEQSPQPAVHLAVEVTEEQTVDNVSVSHAGSKCVCVAGRCVCMLGGRGWGGLAGSGPGRISENIPDPIARSYCQIRSPDPEQRPFPSLKSIISRISNRE